MHAGKQPRSSAFHVTGLSLAPHKSALFFHGPASHLVLLSSTHTSPEASLIQSRFLPSLLAHYSFIFVFVAHSY